jgi:hypothetical protein
VGDIRLLGDHSLGPVCPRRRHFGGTRLVCESEATYESADPRCGSDAHDLHRDVLHHGRPLGGLNSRAFLAKTRLGARCKQLCKHTHHHGATRSDTDGRPDAPQSRSWSHTARRSGTGRNGRKWIKCQTPGSGTLTCAFRDSPTTGSDPSDSAESVRLREARGQTPSRTCNGSGSRLRSAHATEAVHSISMRSPGTASPVTPTIVCAGCAAPPVTSSIAAVMTSYSVGRSV